MVYYEVLLLDIPLPEVQALKCLKVVFHHATRAEVRVKYLVSFPAYAPLLNLYTHHNLL